MHPALSIVFFTTASGAGYGLLALLGLLVPLGAMPPGRLFGLVSLGLALGLIGAGLLSSTAHLSHPERAWRALSQWRSSWLSREGVASLLTFLPALLFGLGWVVLGRTDGWVVAAGFVATTGAVVTVYITSMIYASLKPIAQWHSPYTAPGYLLFALMTGSVLLNALLHFFGQALPEFAALVAVAVAVTWVWKSASWRRDDALEPAATLSSATGLPEAPMRSVEWPHTQENYLLKEMGYRVARKHAVKLRQLVHLCAFALPLTLTLAAIILPAPAATLAAASALLAAAPGVLIERWLFFAEARHTVEVYYRNPGRASE